MQYKDLSLERKKEVEDICNLYCGNNGKKINAIVNKLLRTYPNPEMLEDFYGEAQYLVFDCAVNFDYKKGVPFEPWLRQCLFKKLSTYNRDLTDRDKRRANAEAVSFDEPVEMRDGSEMSRHEIVACAPYIKEDTELSKKRWGDYLRRLTRKQRKIIMMIYDGHPNNEIQQILNITRAEFNRHMAAITIPYNTQNIHDVRLKDQYLA